MSRAPANQVGYTLIELIVTVTVIAVIAAIAVPEFSPGDDRELEVAAAEFAAAMRFARTESIRTGKPYGFRQQSGDKRFRVFRFDDDTIPPTPVYDVYHPVDKQLYDIVLDQHPFAAADAVIRTPVYRGVCTSTGYVYFDENGTPWCTDPDNVLVLTFEVQLDLGTKRRTVRLDGITGRVTVQ